MKECMNNLRNIPSVSEILETPEIIELVTKYNRDLVVYSIRYSLEDLRKNLISDKGTVAKVIPAKAGIHLNTLDPRFHGDDKQKQLLWQQSSHKLNTDNTDLILNIKNLISKITNTSLKPVINATGIILHTNLGRAPIGINNLDNTLEILKGYSNLEFDLLTGKRGKRDTHIIELLKYLTNAPDALIVNNNAAGIILTLNTLAKRKEIIISRGELIEIGGSFRIPDIMKAADVKMVEIGTTNKTRLSDYKKAITPKTGLIIKAHTSNYSIQGFTEEVGIKALADLAHSKNIPFIYDIGSGLLRKPEKINLEKEPDVKTALSLGADLVTFSCDKLLGGPQAGIVAGNRDLIAKLKKAPIMRALRVGKLTLATLINACSNYLDDNSLIKNNPFFSMLERDSKTLKNLADELVNGLTKTQVKCKIIENKGQTGGGSLPDVKLNSHAVLLETNKGIAEKIYYDLLKKKVPVIGILRKGQILFDVLTIFKQDIPYIVKTVSTSYKLFHK